MTANIDGLSPVENLALAKCDLSKKRRGEIAPGDYNVDIIVRICGTVKVGEDYEARETVPWKDLLLTILSNMDSEKAWDRIQVAKNMIGAGLKPDDRIAEATAADFGLTTKACKGKTTAKLEVEALQGVIV